MTQSSNFRVDDKEEAKKYFSPIILQINNKEAKELINKLSISATCDKN